MKTLLLTASAAVLLAGAAQAQQPAQSGQFHLGAGYQYIDADSLDIDALSIRGGYDFTPFFGVEADLLIGLGDETIATIDGERIKGGLDYAIGAYAKAQYPITPEFSVFARGGYIYADAEVSAAGVTVSDNVDGWAFGAGAEWAFAGPNAVRFDYTRYDFTDGNGNADAFGVSYVRRF
jgi:outer membrane immunogenic protein